MAKPKFTTNGDDALKINWVVKILDDCSNIESKKAYKIIAISEEDSLAIIVPFKEVEKMVFTGVRQRSSVYKKLRTSIPLYSMVAVYGTHTDNLEKQEKIKQENSDKKLEKEEKIRAIGLGDELTNILIDVVRKYEEQLHDDMMKRFEEQLEKIGIEGVFYKCEFKEMNMSEIAKTSLKTLGSQGWNFCFELNGKYYFQRPRLKKK